MNRSIGTGLLLLAMASPAVALLPAPDHIIYGTATADGVLVTSGIVTLELETTGLELARYSLGAVADYGNQFALRVAMDMPALGRGWVFLSGGTDGRDGPTEAAGGIVDAGTCDRIRRAGGDPQALLAENDSNRALSLAGDLLVTGATGTNVADVQVLLLG